LHAKCVLVEKGNMIHRILVLSWQESAA